MLRVKCIFVFVILFLAGVELSLADGVGSQIPILPLPRPAIPGQDPVPGEDRIVGMDVEDDYGEDDDDINDERDAWVHAEVRIRLLGSVEVDLLRELEALRDPSSVDAERMHGYMHAALGQRQNFGLVLGRANLSGLIEAVRQVVFVMRSRLPEPLEGIQLGPLEIQEAIADLILVIHAERNGVSFEPVDGHTQDVYRLLYNHMLLNLYRQQSDNGRLVEGYALATRALFVQVIGLFERNAVEMDCVTTFTSASNATYVTSEH